MTFALIVTGLVLVAAFAGMALSWRRRGAGQRHLTVPVPPPAESGADRRPADAAVVLADVIGQYLATTFHGRPLDRVVAAGLGFRARANLLVTDRGVRFDRVGSRPMYLPKAAVLGADVATWTIDRAVEADGLVMLVWQLDSPNGPVAVESAFRLDPVPRAAFVAAVHTLVEAAHADS